MKTEPQKETAAEQAAEAMALIRDRRTMVLSTGGADNCWAAPVYYVFHRGAFYFFSSPSARHIEQGLSGDHAAATIFIDSDRWEEIQGIQMSGRIFQLTKPVEKIAAIARFITKFPFARPFLQSGDDEPTSPPKVGDKVRLYRFVPNEVFYVNNRFGFGKRFKVDIFSSP